MKINEAQQRLNQMLEIAAFDFQNPDPKLGWAVFKAFVQEPVEAAGDGVLFQCGTHNFTGEPLFKLGFVRQFEVEDEDGEYESMEQLHFDFNHKPTEALQNLQKNLWAELFNSRTEFFAAVEALSEFQDALMQTDWTCELWQSKV